MPKFKKVISFVLVFCLFCSMSFGALAADFSVSDFAGLSDAFSSPDTIVNINVTDNIDFGNTSLSAGAGQTYTIGSDNGSGDVIVNTDLGGYTGLSTYDSVNVEVTGNVSGGSDGIYASDDSSVTVTGNVSGLDGDPDDVDYSNPQDYSDGGDGIDADENSSVTVTGNVSGGSVTADPDTVADVGYESYGGDAVIADSSANVTVGGNATGGSTNAYAGVSGSGLYISYTPDNDSVGSISISGSVSSGTASAGNGTNYESIYILDDSDGEDHSKLPSVSVGSYSSIGGNNEGIVEQFKDKLEGRGSGGNSSPVEYADRFWSDVVRQLRNAAPGDEITVDAGDRETVPMSIINTVIEEGVTLIIKWNGGADATIAPDFELDKSVSEYKLADLAK